MTQDAPVDTTLIAKTASELAETLRELAEHWQRAVGQAVESVRASNAAAPSLEDEAFDAAAARRATR